MRTETEVRCRLEVDRLALLGKPCPMRSKIKQEIKALEWILDEPEQVRELAAAGVATLSRERRLQQDCDNLRAEVESLRECHFFGSDYSHARCDHDVIPKGAVQGDGIHWSSTLDDAISDQGAFGGFLLREGTRYVVVEEFDEKNEREPALRLRTEKHYDTLTEANGWSEVPLPEGT